MRISDWSSDVCSSDLTRQACRMDFAPCRNRASLHRGPIRLTTQPATCMPTSRSCLAQVRHTHRSPRSIGCLSEGEGHPYAHSLRSSVTPGAYIFLGTERHGLPERDRVLSANAVTADP